MLGLCCDQEMQAGPTQDIELGRPHSPVSESGTGGQHKIPRMSSDRYAALPIHDQQAAGVDAVKATSVAEATL